MSSLKQTHNLGMSFKCQMRFNSIMQTSDRGIYKARLVLYKRVYGHPIYLQSDIRSIRSVDSFFSHPIYNRQIGKIDRISIISIGNINCHRSVDLILQIRCPVFVDRLSHFCRSVVSFLQIGCLIFCRSVVSFLQIGCLIFVDRLSHFCRSVVSFLQISCLIFVDQLSYFCRFRQSYFFRSVVPFLQIGCLIFVDRLSHLD